MIDGLPDDDPRSLMLDKICQDLSEHFDSVRIFATVHNPDGEDADGTHAITKSRGNWYSTYGFVREWLERQDEASRIEARRKENE